MIHQLKCEPQHFNDALAGIKPYEIRTNDRNFAVGDFLALNEYGEPTELGEAAYTGRCCLLEVVHILDDANYLALGKVCMSVRPCSICRDNDRRPFIDRDVYRVPVYGGSRGEK